MDKFEIEFSVPLTQELKEYIFDCWVAFVTEDLGLQPNQAILIEK